MNINYLFIYITYLNYITIFHNYKNLILMHIINLFNYELKTPHISAIYLSNSSVYT